MAYDDLDAEPRYLSRWSNEQVGLIVHVAGQPTDADNNAVTVSLLPADDPYTVADESVASSPIFTARDAVRASQGTYTVDLSSADTSLPGLYDVVFSYAVGGTADTYPMPIQVGPTAPAYDALSAAWKGLIEDVWVRFADLYDTPFGGPHFQVYLQTRFGRNRMAQLLRIAVGRMNSLAQPFAFYTVDEPTSFPFNVWGSLAGQALYVECLKHFIRTYVEQPEVSGTSVSRLDRRDYMQRWQEILTGEAEDLKEMMSNFKMQHMGLGSVSVLVSGGAFGNFGPTAMPGGAGQAAARGYFYARRFY